ncbi:MAG: ABC transporter ATP-binding protein [Alphaproteobacteria bacterium]|nr:ABC transporter ATP-binding protein [Alphaproteobacteria bacterium]
MVLKLKNISKIFSQGEQKIAAVNGVNLAVRTGEFVALTGQSGSGKTTLLQIAGLLDSPSSGEVWIGDVDASKADDKTRTELRKNYLGFVYQFHHLLPEFSALENVALPLLIRGISKQKALETAEEFLKKVELANRLNHKPAELSGGQQQRVALARAVVTKPKLILADEPTGNLDSELSEKIFVLLKDLVKSYEISCLVVTHNLELVKKADRVVSIKDGTLTS